MSFQGRKQNHNVLQNKDRYLMDYIERDRLVLLFRELNQFKDDHANIITPPVGLVGVVTGALTTQLGSREARIRFYQWAFDPFILSTKDLRGWQRYALVSWAKPAKPKDIWAFDKQFYDDCFILKNIMERA